MDRATGNPPTDDRCAAAKAPAARSSSPRSPLSRSSSPRSPSSARPASAARSSSAKPSSSAGALSTHATSALSAQSLLAQSPPQSLVAEFVSERPPVVAEDSWESSATDEHGSGGYGDHSDRGTDYSADNHSADNYSADNYSADNYSADNDRADNYSADNDSAEGIGIADSYSRGAGSVKEAEEGRCDGGGGGAHTGEREPITYVIERSKDPAVIVDHVKQFLLQYPAQEAKQPRDYACVFDIDGTLLYTMDDVVAAHPAGHALYHFCRDQGFRIVLVTARLGAVTSLDYLQEQLRALQYTGYHSILMVNEEHRFDASPALCKLRSRFDIGKPVLLNVGNRLADMFLTPKCEDSVLSNTNPQTYYVFKGQNPDIVCLKLPAN